MLSSDDERWNYLTGGYKSPFDPRLCLRKLENQQDTAAAWEELWDELHHQGDVVDASYAAVPELVRIHRIGSVADWNLYAMVAIIELARTESQNPEFPDCLRDDYFRSIQELGLEAVPRIPFARVRPPSPPGNEPTPAIPFRL
jgi:hypothetical protein